jgi:hypothetical protein
VERYRLHQFRLEYCQGNFPQLGTRDNVVS